MNVDRRRFLAAVGGIPITGIAGCSGGQAPSDPCADPDFELLSTAEVDADTVKLVIKNQSGERIKPDSVFVVRTDGEIFSTMYYEAGVDNESSFSVTVEINDSPDSISEIELRYYYTHSDSITEEKVCMSPTSQSTTDDDDR